MKHLHIFGNFLEKKILFTLTIFENGNKKESTKKRKKRCIHGESIMVCGGEKDELVWRVAYSIVS